MIERFDCFINDQHIGIMSFFPNGKITMQWDENDKLPKIALMMKKMTPLKTTEDILAFIGERVGPPEQPGMNIWRSMIGTRLSTPTVEVFKAAHGMSINDTFRIEKIQ